MEGDSLTKEIADEQLTNPTALYLFVCHQSTEDRKSA